MCASLTRNKRRRERIRQSSLRASASCSQGRRLRSKRPRVRSTSMAGAKRCCRDYSTCTRTRSPLDGLLNIASGVTSVRDMGNGIEELQRLEKQWQSGTAIGPRVWKCGFIDGHGPFQAPTGLYADTAEEAQAAVNRYADLGYIQIKLYSSLKPEFVPGIAKTARERGMRLSGHVPNGMIATQFVEAGADELQHINFIFLNFLASQVKDTRTPERFTAVGANAAELDLALKPVKDFIELLQKHHTTVDVSL